jgi:hypothetical protein
MSELIRHYGKRVGKNYSNSLQETHLDSMKKRVTKKSRVISKNELCIRNALSSAAATNVC